MITTTIVTSKDGIPFSVQFSARTDADARATERAEADFAATRLACELDGFAPDYQRVKPVAEAVEYAVASFTPRPRPALRVIRGGKS